MKFYLHDKTYDDDLTDCIVYLCSLPCINNSYEEAGNFSFLSVHSTVNVTNDSFEFKIMLIYLLRQLIHNCLMNSLGKI